MFKISVNNKIYFIFNPLILHFSYNDIKLSINIYNIDHYFYIIKKYNISQDYIRNKKNELIKCIDYFNNNEIEFGEEKEVFKEDLILPLNIDTLNFNFPENCNYYDKYCNKVNNFKFINTDKRLLYQHFILGLYNKKNINYFTGKRGIGKTTTILDLFYNNTDYNFIYINLKFFENSNIDLIKKLDVMRFEIRNLFRYKKSKTLKNNTNENFLNSIDLLINKINDEKFIDNKSQNIILCLKKIINYLENLDSNLMNENIILTIKLYLLKLNLKNPKLDINKFENLIKNKNDFKTNIIEILERNKFNLNYINFISKLKFYRDYINKNIFDFIEKLIINYIPLDNECFILLDQYKNTINQKVYIDRIYKQIEKNNKINILICSSIDDEEVRNELIGENSKYQIFDPNI